MVPPQPEVLQALLSPAVLQAHLLPAVLPVLRRREAAVLPDAQAARPAHAAAVLQGFRHLGVSWAEALSVSAELAQLEQELWSGPVSWWALAVAWRRSAVAAAEMVRPSEVRVAGSAQRAAWARPAASSRLGEPAEPRSVEAAGACAQAVPPLVVPAYAELAPRQGAGWAVEAEPQRVVGAARSDAAAGQQRAAEAAGSDAEVAPQRVAEAAGLDAEAEPRWAEVAARLDAAGEQRRAVKVAELDAPAEPRQAAALWDVRGQQQAAAPSVSRRDRALPGPAPQRAVRLAHSKRRMLRAASRSKRSWQAARDEDLSC